MCLLIRVMFFKIQPILMSREIVAKLTKPSVKKKFISEGIGIVIDHRVR